MVQLPTDLGVCQVTLGDVGQQGMEGRHVQCAKHRQGPRHVRRLVPTQALVQESLHECLPGLRGWGVAQPGIPQEHHLNVLSSMRQGVMYLDAGSLSQVQQHLLGWQVLGSGHGPDNRADVLKLGGIRLLEPEGSCSQLVQQGVKLSRVVALVQVRTCPCSQGHPLLSQLMACLRDHRYGKIEAILWNPAMLKVTLDQGLQQIDS